MSCQLSVERLVVLSLAVTVLVAQAGPPLSRSIPLERCVILKGGGNLIDPPPAAPGVPTEPWNRALGASCPGSGAEWGQTWRTPSGRWAVGLVWDGGAEVCAALAHERTDGGVEVASGSARAGHSDRYNEDFLPSVLSRPVLIGGQLFPLLKRITMGGGGGGGDELSILIPVDGGLVAQSLATIGGRININSGIEPAWECLDTLQVRGNTLILVTCFEGERQPPRCFDWNGRDFTRR